MSSRKIRWAWLWVVLVVVGQGWWLRHELAISRADLNDNVLHFTLIERMVEAVERGEHPADFWVSEWTLGYPVPRTYQILGHGVVAGGYLALGKTVDLMTLFCWTRWLLLCLLPLSVMACARGLGLRPTVAAASATLIPLLSSGGLFGLDYSSYLWRGSGLYTQSWAAHCLFLTLGLAFPAVRHGRRLIWAGVLLGLTFLAHFIYGYIGALSVTLMAAIRCTAAPVPRRLMRVAFIGAAAWVVACFQLLPLLLESSMINVSRWEPHWKWNSYGFREVAQQLISGRLLDADRFPVLTILALVGVIIALQAWRSAGEERGWPGRKRRGLVSLALPDTESRAAAIYVLAGTLLWLALYCGRPLWGGLLGLLGISEAMHLHRLIGGVHVFLILAAGIGLGSLWSAATSRRWRVVAALLISLLLIPAIRERAGYLSQNRQWGEQNLAAYRTEASSVDDVLQRASASSGRLYPGLAAGWGGTFRVGSTPLHAFASKQHLPTVSFLYHSMALTSDIMVHFDETDPAQYRLFNISTVLADEPQALPSFLQPSVEVGRFRLFEAPSAGYFELVTVPRSVQVDRSSFYDVNHRWLASSWVAQRQHLRLLWPGESGSAPDPLAASEPLPTLASPSSLGAIESEHREGEVYRAKVRTDGPAHVLFKMTYHHRWRVFVDGVRQPTVMLSPGFLGVELKPGSHDVEWRYQPEVWKSILMALIIPLLGLLWLAEKRGVLRWGEQRLMLASVWVRRRVDQVGGRGEAKRWPLTALGLVALVLPVCWPLLTGRLPSGHDVLEYVPRLVEFHENIRHGILLPRWAPDLSAGNGQPFFLFAPPLLYYISEVFYLIGFDAVRALNAACVVIVLASAGSMFLLGRYLFGKAGGWLAATATIYAPYFLVDLFVRRALAEFVAFPCFALALYGFTRFAAERRGRFLVLGAVAYAAVIFSHFPAALLFSPVLGTWIGFQAWRHRARRSSWLSLLEQGAGVGLGLGLAAAIWLPTLAEMQFTRVDSLLEGYLLYSNHFVYPQQLVWSAWGYGLSLPGYDDEMSFSLGWNILLLIGLAWFWARRWPGFQARAEMRYFAMISLGLCALMLPGAVWLWDTLPLLEYVEFPWRLLSPVTVCLALLVAPLGLVLTRARNSRWWLAGAITVLILPSLSFLKPERYLNLELEDWTPNAIAQRGIAVTTRREYEPMWVEETQVWSSERIREIDGTAEILLGERTPVSWSATIRTAADTELEVATSFFPGWELTRDGEPLPVQIAEGSGLIRFQLPAGEHQVRGRFVRTRVRWIGEGLSLLSAMLCVAIVVRGRRRVVDLHGSSVRLEL